MSRCHLNKLRKTELIFIKTKVNDSFIYFLAEPNIVFVYHIETPQYVTILDFMDGLYKCETFEINHEDDFGAFDHRESQPIEGRGYFINQDSMNEMVEEINKHIQKVRQVKDQENHLGAVHIVTSESAAGSLRFGLKKPNTVIGFSDSFSIGPLWKLDEKAGQSFRTEWLAENINYENDDYEYENKVSNTLREIEDIANHIPIYIWYGNNANEQTALRFYLYLFRDKTNEIFLVNTTELYERYNTSIEEPPIFYTSQMDSEILRTFYVSNKDNRPLADNKRRQFHREWEKLAQTKDVLRLWIDDKIQGVPESYYDPLILETLEKLHDQQGTKDFIKTGNVLGEIVDRMDVRIDIFFLEYRIRYLVYSGALGLKGIPKSMRHYSVKLR